MLGIPEIEGLIPHRAGMLLVDRILELEPGAHVIARKAASYGEPWFRARDAYGTAGEQGLAWPHAVLMESFNQACAVLVMATWKGDGTDVLDAGVPMLGTYTDLSFGAPVLPGDQVTHHVRVLRQLDETMILTGESRVEGTAVLSAGHGLVIRRPADALEREDIPT
ncbi:3-hydroxyacyl-ACP dehydratase FabZ family protein [Streptomyces gobiensis]|uniref:3-hydroxyacyl-ACP dehydratase FabZ family protein n=1 Tax=Streptomyces gobiensis TaxID=2875706 RepID=UPI001E582782|nr:beta-hydroxyacyl-ACP dehydratase [Streptomyces gobiensis]UGY94209.1 beta-hydroxyacyl-ACP dehydratase [Streptomyces gobiensis]